MRGYAMTIYLGIDDTDTIDRPGTGKMARTIAARISQEYTIGGITRHQLLVHPSIPYTSHNSAAVIHVTSSGIPARERVFHIAKDTLLECYIEGSDPGLAAGFGAQITPAVISFGVDAKKTILTQDQASMVAVESGILLEGLAGTGGGIIGALAGIGLAATGNDGRFIMKGRLRGLQGAATVPELLTSGVDRVMTLDNQTIMSGVVVFRKFPKPALIEGEAVLFVDLQNGHYVEVVRG